MANVLQAHRIDGKLYLKFSFTDPGVLLRSAPDPDNITMIPTFILKVMGAFYEVEIKSDLDPGWCGWVGSGYDDLNGRI